jgi:hypothetical protein
LREFDAGVTNFDNLRLGIDLILGINAFDGYRLQFDLVEGRLYLFPTENSCLLAPFTLSPDR